MQRRGLSTGSFSTHGSASWEHMFASGSAQPQHSGGSIGGGKQDQHQGHTHSGLSDLGSLGSFSSHGSASWQRMLDDTDGKHGGRGNEGEVTSKHRPVSPQSHSQAHIVSLAAGVPVAPSASQSLSGQGQSSGGGACEDVRLSKAGKKLSSSCWKTGHQPWNLGQKGYKRGPNKKPKSAPKKPRANSAAQAADAGAGGPGGGGAVSLGDWVGAAGASTSAGTSAGGSTGAAARPKPKRQRTKADPAN